MTYDAVLPAGWLIVTHPQRITIQQLIAHNKTMEERGAYPHPTKAHTHVLPAEYPAYQKKRLIRAGIPEECIEITHTQPPSRQIENVWNYQ